MPLLLPVLFAFALVGTVAAVAVSRRNRDFEGVSVTKARRVVTGARPGGLTETTTEKWLETLDGLTLPDEVGPPTVSREKGWQAVWLMSGEVKNIVWGWCWNELQDARNRANAASEGNFTQWFMRQIERGADYVAGLLRTVFAGLSICVRYGIPATKLKWGNQVVWVATRYPPLPFGSPNSIAGWNPGSSRQGWRASVAPWPAELGEPPKGTLGAMWVRNLGDHWGWGDKFGLAVDVWHVVIWQQGATRYEAGAWKSMYAMSTAGWRVSFILEEPKWQDGKPVGPIGYLKKYAGEGQEFKWKASRRSKAEEAFR